MGNVETKGVKAHFRMDESGLIQLEKVESLFEKTVNEEEAPKAEDPSTLDKIKDVFSNMWGDNQEEGSAEKPKEEKPEEKTQEEEKKSEEKKEEKKSEEKEE